MERAVSPFNKRRKRRKNPVKRALQNHKARARKMSKSSLSLCVVIFLSLSRSDTLIAEEDLLQKGIRQDSC